VGFLRRGIDHRPRPSCCWPLEGFQRVGHELVRQRPRRGVSTPGTRRAARDAQDIKHLTEVLNLHTVAEVLALVQDVFPEEEPPPRLRLLLEDIFGRSI
jgi:hypothetical protein